MDEGRIVITPHTDLRRAALRDEALRTARFVAPDAPRHEVAFSA